MRLNGTRIMRSGTLVRVGDVITVPVGAVVRVLRITAMPARRGPAHEAQSCYDDLDLG